MTRAGWTRRVPGVVGLFGWWVSRRPEILVGTGPACDAVVHKAGAEPDPAGALLVRIAAWRAAWWLPETAGASSPLSVEIPAECTLPFRFWPVGT